MTRAIRYFVADLVEEVGSLPEDTRAMIGLLRRSIAIVRSIGFGSTDTRARTRRRPADFITAEFEPDCESFGDDLTLVVARVG